MHVSLGGRQVGVAGEVAHVDERDRRVVGEPGDPRVTERVKDDLSVLGDRQGRPVAGLPKRPLDIVQASADAVAVAEDEAGPVRVLP
jgi:hypothetical protein